MDALGSTEENYPSQFFPCNLENLIKVQPVLQLALINYDRASLHFPTPMFSFSKTTCNESIGQVGGCVCGGKRVRFSLALSFVCFLRAAFSIDGCLMYAQSKEKLMIRTPSNTSCAQRPVYSLNVGQMLLPHDSSSVYTELSRSIQIQRLSHSNQTPLELKLESACSTLKKVLSIPIKKMHFIKIKI